MVMRFVRDARPWGPVRTRARADARSRRVLTVVLTWRWRPPSARWMGGTGLKSVGRLALLGELGLDALAARLPVGFTFAQCCHVSLSRR
jgi:hypothetical protein